MEEWEPRMLVLEREVKDVKDGYKHLESEFKADVTGINSAINTQSISLAGIEAAIREAQNNNKDRLDSQNEDIREGMREAKEVRADLADVKNEVTKAVVKVGVIIAVISAAASLLAPMLISNLVSQ